jgi:hypothetical protein
LSIESILIIKLICILLPGWVGADGVSGGEYGVGFFLGLVFRDGFDLGIF